MTTTDHPVTRARKRAGMSQEILAAELGIARTALAALEAGTRGLKADELYKLSEILGVPMASLIETAKPKLDFAPLYRLFTEEAGGRVAESASHYGEALRQGEATVEKFRDQLERWVELLEYADAQPPELVAPPQANLGNAVPARALADWVRYQCGIGPTAPIHNLRHMAESGLGILVFLSHDHDSPLSGASIKSTAAGACIFLRHGMREHMRFTMAHEIGHLLAHPGQAHGSGKGMHDAIRSQETYANQFAAELLMPADGIREAVGGVEELESHRTIQRLAWRFRVSFKAVAVRLESMRFLKRGWYERELERMRQEGSVPNEPVDPSDLVLRPDPRQCESMDRMPALFRQTATMLLDEGILGFSKFCQLMGEGWDLDRAEGHLRRVRLARMGVEEGWRE